MLNLTKNFQSLLFGNYNFFTQYNFEKYFKSKYHIGEKQVYLISLSFFILSLFIIGFQTFLLKNLYFEGILIELALTIVLLRLFHYIIFIQFKDYCTTIETIGYFVSAFIPLKTSSGLIEIVCPEAVKAGLPSIPSYIGVYEGSELYPLQLLTPHSRIRSHSCLHTNPWLQRLEPHSVWINSKDATVRGIQNGEVVEVMSETGTMRIPAMVTERIMPGVVCVYQGTWYQPSSDGVDEGGCANVLAGHITSVTGGFATHSDWVEVRRVAN